LVGILFAIPTTHVQAWRLGAWAVSGIAYATQIVYERYRLLSSSRVAATHVAFAAALGAFGLAVGANIHSMFTGSTEERRQLLVFSLVIAPAITALPAFLVALVTNMLIERALGSVHSRSWSGESVDKS
jgi:hypothetical protein